MSRKNWVIVLVAVIAAVLIGLMFLLLDSCEVGPPYVIESERSSQEPQQFIVLNSSHIEQYPIIGEVIDAFDNPEDHPNAEFRHGVLHYYVYDEMAVSRASDYISERYRSEYSSPNWDQINLAYDKGDGQGMQYYTWAEIAIDYSVPVYCP